MMKPSLHHAALSALPVAVVVLDGQGCLVFSNKGWHRLFECREDVPSALGTPYELLHPAVCGEALDAVAIGTDSSGAQRCDLASYSHSYSCVLGEEIRTFDDDE